MKKSGKPVKSYKHYRDNCFILAGVAAAAASAFFVAGYIFSENVFLSVLFSVVGIPIVLKEFISWRRSRIVLRIEEQFAGILQAALTSLSSGQTIEQTFSELAENGMGKRADMKPVMRELRIINRKVQMHYSFYEAFEDFAERSGSADIKNFSSALKITSARGGNLVFLVRNALADLRVKLETDREIRHTLALPRYNHRIMTVMPFFLIYMLKTISYEYVHVLYITRTGQIVSVCAAAAILLAWILGDRLCRVKF